MKLIKKSILASLALAAMVMAVSNDAAAETVANREHRAVWLSSGLSSSWPSSDITDEVKAKGQRTILANRLKKLKDQNLNVIYFHVRSNCDAMYKSSYEPWSKEASGTRGVAPYEDPLQIIIEEAHKVGIELYAWVNPYRYSNNVSYGSDPIEYENSHPDWLLKNAMQTVLNPGLEEVKQRVVDVISEIVTNYDVDGIIFDDYFYGQGGTSEGSDAPDYSLWKSANSGMSIGDWRRANINEMVKRVNTAIKKIKPWMPFGISPAGVAGANASEHGLPSISGDWQYNQIYSDPLAWLKAGTIDYISPQIYWISKFDNVATWWSTATKKYGRHFYPSVESGGTTDGYQAELIRENHFARDLAGRDLAGFVHFEWADYINVNQNVYGTNASLGANFATGVWVDKALTPIRSWNNDYNPRMTSNVRREGTTLVWDAVEGCRYTVYAVPAGTESAFGGQREFLDGISYTNSYEIPTDKSSGYTFAVAVYDRYGNEYSPLFENATVATLPAPQLTYPANGSSPGFLFDFAWQSQGTRHIFELAEDAGFTKQLAYFEVAGKSLPLSEVPKLTTGKTYYWRVHMSSPNARYAVSETYSFVASEIGILKPANGATGQAFDGLEVAWQKAVAGTDYTLTISANEAMTNPVYSRTFTDVDNIVLPVRVLSSAKKYYMTISAVNGGTSSTSAPISFTTAEKTDYAALEFGTPATPGATVYSNQAVTVKNYTGLRDVVFEISASNTFPSRSTKKYTITDFTGATDPMGECKIASKALVSGTTYYVRVRGSFNKLGTTTPGYTEYTQTNFVYSSSAGIGDVNADDAVANYVDSEGVLHLASGAEIVNVYNLAGQLALSLNALGESVDLSELPAGVYVIRVAGANSATIKWVH